MQDVAHARGVAPLSIKARKTHHPWPQHYHGTTPLTTTLRPYFVVRPPSHRCAQIRTSSSPRLERRAS
eukprot:scaffold110355_cov31-Tisochrysis_lutea.AAC.1